MAFLYSTSFFNDSILFFKLLYVISSIDNSIDLSVNNLWILIISILVLAVSTSSSGPGPLVTHVTSRGASNFRVPVTLVPDTMTDEAIDALT